MTKKIHLILAFCLMLVVVPVPVFADLAADMDKCQGAVKAKNDSLAKKYAAEIADIYATLPDTGKCLKEFANFIDKVNQAFGNLLNINDPLAGIGYTLTDQLLTQLEVAIDQQLAALCKAALTQAQGAFGALEGLTCIPMPNLTISVGDKLKKLSSSPMFSGSCSGYSPLNPPPALLSTNYGPPKPLIPVGQ